MSEEKRQIQVTDEMVERAQSVRTFGLRCGELGGSFHDFIWVGDLPAALEAALNDGPSVGEEEKPK